MLLQPSLCGGLDLTGNSKPVLPGVRSLFLLRPEPSLLRSFTTPLTFDQFYLDDYLNLV